MTKRIKTVFILLSVVLIAVFASSMGMTLAIWTSTGSGLDNNTVAPATDSTIDWNVWAKYFDGIVVNENTHTVAITAFHTDDYGLNLETVVIPTDIDVNGTQYKVVEIRSQVFADNTLKQLPVTLYIPPTVTRINAMSFANLPNLTRIVFGSDDAQPSDCVIDDYAFMMCVNLDTIITSGRTLTDSNGLSITSASNAFIGCAPGLSIAVSI